MTAKGLILCLLSELMYPRLCGAAFLRTYHAAYRRSTCSITVLYLHLWTDQ